MLTTPIFQVRELHIGNKIRSLSLIDKNTVKNWPYALECTKVFVPFLPGSDFEVVAVNDGPVASVTVTSLASPKVQLKIAERTLVATFQKLHE